MTTKTKVRKHTKEVGENKRLNASEIPPFFASLRASDELRDMKEIAKSLLSDMKSGSESSKRLKRIIRDISYIEKQI